MPGRDDGPFLRVSGKLFHHHHVRFPPFPYFLVENSLKNTVYGCKSGQGRKESRLYNFTGGNDPFLGIGGPEIVVILMMGYFLLGPKELYHLIKQVGKFIGHFRGISTNLMTSLQNIIKRQTEMMELSMSDESLDVKWGNVREGDSGKSKETLLEAVLLKEGLSRGDVEIFDDAETLVMNGDEEEESERYEYIWEDEVVPPQPRLTAVQGDWKDFWISARASMANIVDTTTINENAGKNLLLQQVIKGTEITRKAFNNSATSGEQRNDISSLLQETDASETSVTGFVDKNTTIPPPLTTVMTESWRHLDGNRLLPLKPTSSNYDDGGKNDETENAFNRYDAHYKNAAEIKYLESVVVDKLVEDQNEFMQRFEKEFETKIKQLRTDMIQIIEKGIEDATRHAATHKN